MPRDSASADADVDGPTSLKKSNSTGAHSYVSSALCVSFDGPLPWKAFTLTVLPGTLPRAPAPLLLEMSDPPITQPGTDALTALRTADQAATAAAEPSACANAPVAYTIKRIHEVNAHKRPIAAMEIIGGTLWCGTRFGTIRSWNMRQPAALQARTKAMLCGLWIVTLSACSSTMVGRWYKGAIWSSRQMRAPLRSLRIRARVALPTLV